MSKRGIGRGDWSSDAEALFQAARMDQTHASTPADRARVRRALAQRLAAGAAAPAAGGDAQTTLRLNGTSRAAFSQLVKIGLGVACVVAGTFALTRGGDAKRLATSQAITAQARIPGAESAQDARQTAAPAPAAVVAALNHAPVAAVVSHSEGAPRPQRPAPRRSRLRSTTAKTAVRVASEAKPVAAHEPRLRPETDREFAAAKPSALDVSPVISKRAAEPTSATARNSSSEAGLEPRADPRPSPPTADSPPQTGPATMQSSNNGRAELAFVARIRTALLGAKLQTVLSLCLEHEKRWPEGTFVQEREGLRAIASCGAGASGADIRARSFLDSYPRNPLAPRVRDACGAVRESR